MSNPINDGGPAFPGSSGVYGYGPSRPIECGTMGTLWENLEHGISMRDYFAAKAMESMLTHWGFCSELGRKEMAQCAFQCADAMLAERVKNGGQS